MDNKKAQLEEKLKERANLNIRYEVLAMEIKMLKSEIQTTMKQLIL